MGVVKGILRRNLCPYCIKLSRTRYVSNYVRTCPTVGVHVCMRILEVLKKRKHLRHENLQRKKL